VFFGRLFADTLRARPGQDGQTQKGQNYLDWLGLGQGPRRYQSERGIGLSVCVCPPLRLTKAFAAATEFETVRRGVDRQLERCDSSRRQGHFANRKVPLQYVVLALLRIGTTVGAYSSCGIHLAGLPYSPKIVTPGWISACIAAGKLVGTSALCSHPCTPFVHTATDPRVSPQTKRRTS
jgi:hypothetical protein